MRVLVLGSDGQIGAPLAAYLREQGHSVVEFDNYSNPYDDLRIPHILNSILREVDFVFFLAFDVGGAIYLKNYQDTYDFISNNMKIMSNTFDSLQKFKTPFIFASSQMSEMSHSTYGILKSIGERYVNDMQGKVVRFWNVYGPERDTDKMHVISDFIKGAEDGVIEMMTTGDEQRQFLYVRDCCECLEILMKNYYMMPKKIDVSSFEWIRISDIAQLVALNFNCRIIPGMAVDDVQRSTLNDPDKEILKYWQPKTDINIGIKYCIDERRNSHNGNL